LTERPLNEVDPEIYAAIRGEERRERDNLVMIASENYASRAVIDAQASVMTNKYAEGYPGSRYYGGCEYVDVVERLAVDRAKDLFGAEYVNVQPHSGSQANMAVYMGFLNPGDMIMGMGLSQGGHLTHGSPVSFSGKVFKSVSYGLDPETHRIDYDRVRQLVEQHQPRLLIAGASAYPREIDFRAFSEIARDNGAFLMADIAHIAGLIAVGLHNSPVGLADFVTTSTHKTLRGPRGGMVLSQERHGEQLDRGVFPGVQGGPLMHVIAAKAVAFKEALGEDFEAYQRQVVKNARSLAEALLGCGFDLVSGGTDNHLILMDLSRIGVSGKEAEKALGLAGIVANKNTIPFDRKGPNVTSGLRLGTPALTTRGMKESDIAVIAGFLKQVLENHRSETVLNRIRGEVSELCSGFPIYGYLGEEV